LRGAGNSRDRETFGRTTVRIAMDYNVAACGTGRNELKKKRTKRNILNAGIGTEIKEEPQRQKTVFWVGTRGQTFYRQTRRNAGTEPKIPISGEARALAAATARARY